MDLRVEKGFHGSHANNLRPIATNGLLRVGHPQNPSQRIDPGYFGSTDKGIYVSRYVDYCLKYANGLEPLLPGNEVLSLSRSSLMLNVTGLIPSDVSKTGESDYV
jgi:hypothetical protein